MCPTEAHQRRSVATANAEVSWSRPTDTQPVLAATSKHPVWDCLADRGIGEVMHLHPLRVALGRHSRPSILSSPTRFHFLASTLTTGPPACLWARACALR